ncbi:hypothetical protein GGF37_003665, partial [Kickxella alabastrina]
MSPAGTISQPLASGNLLSGTNYQLWKELVLDVLDDYGLEHAVKEPVLLTSAEASKMTDRNKLKVVRILLKCMQPDIAGMYHTFKEPY